MSKEFTIRRATPADAEQCAPIIYAAFSGIADRHNFPSDFPSLAAVEGLMKLISHPQVAGFVAENAGGKIIGVNFLHQCNSIGGVGPIAVAPPLQGQGCGKRLMQAVVEHGRDMRGIRLVQDAFNTVSMSLYTSLGFDAQEPLALMTGRISARPDGNAEGRPMQSSDLDACAALCRQIHGFDRSGELVDALGMFRPFVLCRDARVVAYSSAPYFWPLNHGVAQTQHDMEDLLAAASRASDEPLALLIPIRRAGLFRWCLSNGLRIVKPMTLMTMREYQEPQGAFYPSVLY